MRGRQTGARTPRIGSASGPVERPRGQTVPRLRRWDLRRGAAVGFPIAFPSQVEDLGPLGEPIEDGVGHGVIGEDLVPLAEDPVRGDHRRLVSVVPHREDLEEQVNLGLVDSYKRLHVLVVRETTSSGGGEMRLALRGAQNLFRVSKTGFLFYPDSATALWWCGSQAILDPLQRT
jgi:hypothetical protein